MAVTGDLLLRYLHDAEFHALVHALHAQVLGGRFSERDLSDALQVVGEICARSRASGHAYPDVGDWTERERDRNRRIAELMNGPLAPPTREGEP